MPPEVRSEMARCRPWIEAALARQNLYRFEDVEAAVAEGRAQIWPCPKGVIVTTVEQYPAGPRVLQGWLAGGDLAALVEGIGPRIEAEARDRLHCTHVLIDAGRRGWERALTASGYVFQGVSLMKDLRT